jgi:DNA polymerase-3 subunit delta
VVTPAPRRGGGDGGIAEARAAFAKGDVGPVVLLAGPERLFAEELVAIAVERFVPEDFRVFNVNRYRGGEDSAQAILNTAGTLPMFTERRVVVVADADEMPRADLEALAAWIANPAPSTLLILVAQETGERVPAALRKVPERYVLWRPFPRDAIAWCRDRAKALGRELPAPVAEELYALCAGDSGDGRAALSDLAVELEKLTLVVGQRRTIQSEDLKVVGRHAESRVLYQVESSVADRNLPAALEALDAALLFPRENGPIRIVVLLAERFRKMLLARDRMDAGYATSAVVAGMWFPGPAGATPFLRSVGLYRRTELVQALQELARLDRALKTGQAEPERLHLELLLRRLCGVPRSPRAVGGTAAIG